MVVYLKDGTQEHVFSPNEANEWARILEDRLGPDIVNQMRYHRVLESDDVVRGRKESAYK